MQSQRLTSDADVAGVRNAGRTGVRINIRFTLP